MSKVINICKSIVSDIILSELKKNYSSSSIDIDVYSFLERPPEINLGDYAFPCFKLSKQLKASPMVIANTLSESINKQKYEWISSCEVAGAFLNIKLNHKKLAEYIFSTVSTSELFSQISKDPDFKKQTVMIEFSQPNTHKEFHIGHLRNLFLGDSLCRLFRYCGHNVIAANYPGDEGAHIAKCLWYIDKTQALKDAPSEDQGGWLGDFYTGSVKKLASLSEEERKEASKELSSILNEIESKNGRFYDMWKLTRQWSLDSFYRIYDYFDVKFDCYFFESELSAISQQIVDEYLEKGIFTVSEGAVGMDLKEDNLGFLLLRKQDGNTLYATKDLALARKKFETYHVEKSIYVVASEQNLHFEQVFKTLEHMGFSQAKDCFHLSYGLVVLPEGKMSSREGNVVKFKELRSRIEDELSVILNKYKESWDKTEIQSTKQKLCVGALKYGMLNTDPIKNVVFNLKEWISFEGNSGPYLMYTYARTSSILKKAREGLDIDTSKVHSDLSFEDPASYEVLNYIQDFNEVVLQSCSSYKPSILTHYLFDMCKAFNRFYIKCPVLKEENKDILMDRVALVEAFSKTLRQGLSLLGITPPDRM